MKLSTFTENMTVISVTHRTNLSDKHHTSIVICTISRAKPIARHVYCRVWDIYAHSELRTVGAKCLPIFLGPFAPTVDFA